MRILNIKNTITALIFIVGLGLQATAQTGKVTIEQNDLIPELLEMKSELTKDGKLGERYSIQLYYGDNNTASNIIKEFRVKYSDMPSSIIYETPNYKVWVGNFRNRLEADRALMQIKNDFPSAFIPKPSAR